MHIFSLIQNKCIPDLNLVDWSKSNLLAVALGNAVYLWNASSGAITQLTELEGNDYVSSLSWITDGDTLAIGTSLGNTQVLCPLNQKWYLMFVLTT